MNTQANATKVARGGRLEGKTALITGGGGGIGAATAILFCEQGASVLLVDMDGEALVNTARSIAERVPGARVVHQTADVSDPQGAQEAVARCAEAFGRLDVLVNNASMRNYSALAQATPAEWQAVVGVNLIGTANYCRAALPLLRQAPGASIVNVSSCYAVAGRKGMGLYDATKAGILALTRTLAFEEAPHRIRVNAVCPGSTLTDFHLKKARAAGGSIEKLKTQRQDTSLIGRWADPIEIAYPILWLASDEASFMTGSTVMVDAGLSIM